MREQRQLAAQRGVIINLFRLQRGDITQAAEIAIGEQAAKVFEVDAAAVNARVKGVSHLLNIGVADVAAITGITGDGDAEKLR